MRFSRSLLLASIAWCATALGPQFCTAQVAPLTPSPVPPFTAGPLSLTPPNPNPPATPPTLPSTQLSLQPTTPQNTADTSPQTLYACACGCGIFDVGTASMLPHGQGGMVWVEWDYQDQNHNRHDSSSAPSSQNDDKEIRTEFYNLGLQYFFDRAWGLQIEVPVDHRHFATADAAYDWTSLGDIRLKGLYTGFSEDQSLGVSLGLKLPTGNFKQNGPDRDTELGTGSTDILVGGFFRTYLASDGTWNLFAQLSADLPVLIQDQYRPGFEVDAAAGVYYSGFTFHDLTISPVGQILLSYRTSDTGANAANPVASGYQRVLLSPGIEFDIHPFTIYADVEFPVYQYFRGDQLAAPMLFKVLMSFRF